MNFQFLANGAYKLSVYKRYRYSYCMMNDILEVTGTLQFTSWRSIIIKTHNMKMHFMRYLIQLIVFKRK